MTKFLLSLFIVSTSHLKAQTSDSTFLDLRDSTEYKTITINNKIWFVDDLKYGDVDSVDIVHNVKVDGYFYSKEAALKSCPNGWSLPTVKDWEEVLNFIASENNPTKNKMHVNYRRNKLEHDVKGMNFFSHPNPLTLSRDGRIDHGILKQYGLVDYWVDDFVNQYTHTHISPNHVTIHNHKREIIENELPVRLFKVKCVCEKNN